jgi:hypothetical protein
MLKKAAFATCLLALTVVAKSPRGTVPQPSPEKYAAHAEQDGNGVGASLLKADQAKKTFGADLEKCCVAVEVALYPKKDGMIEVSLDDFVLRVGGNDTGTHATSPDGVAARLDRPQIPSASESAPEQRDHKPGINTTNDIGYQTGGIDPVTGQPRPGGIVYRTGVSVGGPFPDGPRSKNSGVDPKALETELSEKALPEGNTMAPVSGYVYFPLIDAKKKAKEKYQLEYMLNGKKIVLPLQAAQKVSTSDRKTR